MGFDLSLLQYMDRKVRFKMDITHQEYKVAGIDWEKKTLLVIDVGFWVKPNDVELVPEETDEV